MALRDGDPDLHEAARIGHVTADTLAPMEPHNAISRTSEWIGENRHVDAVGDRVAFTEVAKDDWERARTDVRHVWGFDDRASQDGVRRTSGQARGP